MGAEATMTEGTTVTPGAITIADTDVTATMTMKEGATKNR
jgi:hypothetical protein